MLICLNDVLKELPRPDLMQLELAAVGAQPGVLNTHCSTASPASRISAAPGLYAERHFGIYAEVLHRQLGFAS